MKNFILMIVISTFFTGCVALAPQGFQNQPAGWTNIQVNKRIDHTKGWVILVDQIGEKYEFATMDSSSGYLKTTWLLEGYSKTRITAKLNESILKIKVESQYYDDFESRWIMGTNIDTTKNLKDDLSGRFN